MKTPSEIAHTLQPGQLALVTRFRAVERFDTPAPEPTCERSAEQRRMVVTTISISSKSSRHERHSINRPRRRQGARHHLRQGISQPLLALILEHAHDAPSRIRKRHRARARFVRKALAPHALQHHIVASVALHDSVRRTTCPARAPPIEIRQVALAPFAKDRSRRIANRAARRPQRFGSHLRRESRRLAHEPASWSVVFSKPAIHEDMLALRPYREARRESPVSPNATPPPTPGNPRGTHPTSRLVPRREAPNSNSDEHVRCKLKAVGLASRTADPVRWGRGDEPFRVQDRRSRAPAMPTCAASRPGPQIRCAGNAYMRGFASRTADPVQAERRISGSGRVSRDRGRARARDARRWTHIRYTTLYVMYKTPVQRGGDPGVPSRTADPVRRGRGDAPFRVQNRRPRAPAMPTRAVSRPGSPIRYSRDSATLSRRGVRSESGRTTPRTPFESRTKKKTRRPSNYFDLT